MLQIIRRVLHGVDQDIIQMKKEAKRRQDLEDIQALEVIRDERKKA